jgi:hypothetical protein
MSAATSSRINEQTGVPANPAKRDHRQEVTDCIVNMLEQGVAPWQKPWDGVGIPTLANEKRLIARLITFCVVATNQCGHCECCRG